MPIHDWSQVSPAVFADFRLAWTVEIQRALNRGVLPNGFYALIEQIPVTTVPDPRQFRPIRDVLADEERWSDNVGLAATPEPQLRRRDTLAKVEWPRPRHGRVTVRREVGDVAVSTIEIVSAEDKASVPAVERFVGDAVGSLRSGLNLVMVDLFPSTDHDIGGIHTVVWSRLGGHYRPPTGFPLTIVAYVANGDSLTSHAEPTAVGRELINAPMFLTPDHSVDVPLEPTYLAAYGGIARCVRHEIESG